jgi:NADPH:quinone reductase-like Zn-dependent oxidoreductase
MALIATMRGVVWEGTPFQMSVRPVAMPYLQAETDAIIKTSATAICGSDLHIYRGIYGSPEVPWTMSHGGMGYIQDIGNGVVHHSVGDLVVIPGGSDPSVLEMEGPELGVGFALGRTWGDAEGSGCQGDIAYLSPPLCYLTDN